jgi:hypothetical protein
MTNRRLSTVYDYASLRLHRDGTRVQQSDVNNRQFAVKDANGNWIATDAGGLGRTRYVRQGTDEEREHKSLGHKEEQAEKEHERKQKRARKDLRTGKRRRFYDETLDFLDVLHASSSGFNQTQEPCVAVPSSVCHSSF